MYVMAMRMPMWWENMPLQNSADCFSRLAKSFTWTQNIPMPLAQASPQFDPRMMVDGFRKDNRVAAREWALRVSETYASKTMHRFPWMDRISHMAKRRKQKSRTDRIVCKLTLGESAIQLNTALKRNFKMVHFAKLKSLPLLPRLAVTPVVTKCTYSSRRKMSYLNCFGAFWPR